MIGRYAEIVTDWPALITTAHKSSIHYNAQLYKYTVYDIIEKHKV